MVSYIFFCSNWIFNWWNNFVSTFTFHLSCRWIFFLPFGREIVSTKYLKQFKDYEKTRDKDFDNASGIIRFLANIIWVLTFGWILALLHILAGILNVLLIWTIVAIPNIMAHFRMVPVAFAPFGRKVISKEVAQKLRDMKADKDIKNIIS